MTSEELLKSEKKKLLRKISIYLSSKLQRMQADKEWTDLELAAKTGWSNTRISELRNFEKYQINLPEKHLPALILKGLLTVTELKQNIDLNVKEASYVDTLKVYEILKKRPDLAGLIIQIDESGQDPSEIPKKNLE